MCFTETKAWSLVDVKGEVPPVRVGATMQQINGKLYLFGGLSHTSGWFQDLHVFDIGTVIFRHYFWINLHL